MAKTSQATDPAQSSTVGKLNIRVCLVLREQDTHKPKVMCKIDLVMVIDWPSMSCKQPAPASP